MGRPVLRDLDALQVYAGERVLRLGLWILWVDGLVLSMWVND